MLRVLVVDDEPEIADLLGRTLREQAWAVDVVPTGHAALEALAINEYDLAVLDVNLPDQDGFAVCRQWRARGGRTPILMLTARGAVNDRVVGLDAGADDYLPKPFAVPELLARLRALARRPPDTAAPLLEYADLELDPATHAVRRAGVPLRLTAREYALTEYLMRHPSRIVSRGTLLQHVWDDNFDPVGNAVDVLVGRVRRKIDLPELTPLIHTVRGAGYILSREPPGDAS